MNGLIFDKIILILLDSYFEFTVSAYLQLKYSEGISEKLYASGFSPRGRMLELDEEL